MTDPNKWAFDPNIQSREELRGQVERDFADLKRHLYGVGITLPESISELRRKLQESWALIPFPEMVNSVLGSADRPESFKSALRKIYSSDYKFDCHMTHTSGAYLDFIVEDSGTETRFDPSPSEDQIILPPI
jgi:hypothetical protein